ncbi:MAG: hypothetical protein V4726_02270 [Verrucomicrobiota bacterium]
MKPALIHGTWLAVAAGAYFAGNAFHKTAAPAAGPKTVLVGPGMTAAEKAGSLKTSAVSRDASIAEFLGRYELGTGKPLSSEKMREAMSEALRETDPIKSTMLFARLLEELTPGNAAESMTTLRESISGFEMMRYMPLLAYQWGSVDAKGALEALDGQNGRENMMAKPIILSGLASKDPAAAEAWLAAQKDLPGKEFYTQSIINGMAKSDPDAAVAFAAKQEKPEERSRAAETIAQEKIKGGIESAASWAAGLKDPDMKKGAAQAIANQYSRTDPAKAAEYIKQYAGEEWASNAIGDVTGSLARKNPEEAMKFAASIQGGNQTNAYREAVQEWTRQDATAASTYVNQMTQGPARDSSAAALANVVAREGDPSTGIIWANSISDPATRQEALVDVARSYMRQNPEGYAAWVPTSGLSAEAQQQISERGNGGGGGGRNWGGPGGGGFGGLGGGRRGGR